ncbi:MAG: 4-hydroxythreonine-4-phosphate dehydrogenase PdxA [Gammaproteobacteria bacterium]
MSAEPNPAHPLVITVGEPAGIGPDLIVLGAQSARRTGWVVVGDADVLRQRAVLLGRPLVIDDALDTPATGARQLTVLHVPVARKVVPGVLDVANAAHVLRLLEIAADGCQQGRYRALVTGPVQKSIINDAGVPFSGHTEFFCERAGVPDVLMLLVAGTLRVGLATTHLPLRQVADAITAPVLTRRLGLLLDGLRQRFGIAAPRVLVAGLNPHAGEGGHLGHEEIEIIEPVCAALRAGGEQIRGPLPADTLFTGEHLAGADAVFAMYHDQGLPVLKHAGFGGAVNVTLGLPYVRTSVDHGTALDLAGTGRVHAGSFEAALALAAELR